MDRYNVHAECGCNTCQTTYANHVIPHFKLSDNGRWVRYGDVKKLEEELFELMEFKNSIMTLIETRENQ
jgi:hypothetical protein